jgi:hypothetical protein
MRESWGRYGPSLPIPPKYGERPSRLHPDHSPLGDVLSLPADARLCHGGWRRVLLRLPLDLRKVLRRNPIHAKFAERYFRNRPKRVGGACSVAVRSTGPVLFDPFFASQHVQIRAQSVVRTPFRTLSLHSTLAISPCDTSHKLVIVQRPSGLFCGLASHRNSQKVPLDTRGGVSDAF